MFLPVISPVKLGVCVKVNKHNNLLNTSLQKWVLPVPDQAGRRKTLPLSYSSKDTLVLKEKQIISLIFYFKHCSFRHFKYWSQW